MSLEDLNEEQKQKLAEFKKMPRNKGRPPKEFGPLLKAAALVLKDLKYSNKAIAAELKVSPDTVSKMFRDTAIKLETKDLNKIKEIFSGEIAEIVFKMLTAANSHTYVDNLARSKNPGLIQALTSLIEKHQLLNNKPSNITEVRDTAKLIADKFKELEDMEAALRQATVLPNETGSN